MSKQRNDNLSQVADFHGLLDNSQYNYSIRIEEVYSMKNINDLKASLEYLREVGMNRSTKILLNGKNEVKLENFGQHVKSCVGPEIRLLESSMDKAETNGSFSLTNGTRFLNYQKLHCSL